MPTEKAKSIKKKVKQAYVEAVGRRKSSVARVRIFTNKRSAKNSEGTSNINVNEKLFTDYFSTEKLRRSVEGPFKKIKVPEGLEVSVKVKGGGITGQADAIRLGIARALKQYNPEFLDALREADLLTRDPRMKERKKPGLLGARRGQQWSKR